MNPANFVEKLRKLRWLDNRFNPYSSRCPDYDLDDAPQRRSRILESLLTVALNRDVESVWIGQALGRRGGRRTGLALTDDVHFDEHLDRWGLSWERPTRGPMVKEQSATAVWEILSQIEVPVFLWNVFPLHPHEPYNPCRNRALKAAERKCGEEFLAELVFSLRPRRLIALGNDAFKSAHRIYPCNRVFMAHHPSPASPGGRTKFLRCMKELYPGLLSTVD